MYKLNPKRDFAVCEQQKLESSSIWSITFQISFANANTIRKGKQIKRKNKQQKEQKLMCM